MYELSLFRITLKQEALFNIINNQILYYRLFLKTSKRQEQQQNEIDINRYSAKQIF